MTIVLMCGQTVYSFFLKVFTSRSARSCWDKEESLIFLTFRGGHVWCLLLEQTLLYYVCTCCRYGDAAEMYAKVLALKPGEWRAQLNRAVSLLGAGDYEEARKAFKEAFKMTNRVELYDAIKHLKQMQKRPKDLTSAIASAEQSATGRRSSIAGEFSLEILNSQF